MYAGKEIMKTIGLIISIIVSLIVIMGSGFKGYNYIDTKKADAVIVADNKLEFDCHKAQDRYFFLDQKVFTWEERWKNRAMPSEIKEELRRDKIEMQRLWDILKQCNS